MPENAPDPADRYGLEEAGDPWPPAADTEVTPSVGTPISVEIRLQIGEVRKTFSTLASTDAEDPFKVARGLLTGMREDANDYLLGLES